MKERYFVLFILVLFALPAVSLYAQTYEATISQNVSGGQLYVDIYLRTTSGTSENLGDATLTFQYNSAALTYVGKDSDYDGRWDNDNSSDYVDCFGSNSIPYASITIQKNSGTGLNIPTSSTRVGRVVFNITDPLANSQIVWNSFLTFIKNWDETPIKSKFTLQNPPDVSLPVELFYFSAQAEDGKVVLSWQTESEVDNLGFNIYRSTALSGTRLKLNTQVIDGAGTTVQRQNYSFVDDRIEETGTYFYFLEQLDLGGAVSTFGPVSIAVDAVLIPDHYTLEQNYPNPFNPGTLIRYGLPQAGYVKLVIYNMRGETVRVLLDEQKSAGTFQAYWDGHDGVGMRVPTGLYFYKLSADGYSEMRKMVLSR
ncbi:T9SS type A sorting domain-containing protein [candidate division KSB1 bacterium]|nr:T9SS type A sorting domain-containing protein [candidate division KSB1 bacterium]